MIKQRIQKTVTTNGWDTIKINEAIQMIEECVSQATEPLEQVRIVAKEARNIHGLPQNIDLFLLCIIGEIDRIIGGSEWETIGKLKTGVQSIRDQIRSESIGEKKKYAKVTCP